MSTHPMAAGAQASRPPPALLVCAAAAAAVTFTLVVHYLLAQLPRADFVVRAVCALTTHPLEARPSPAANPTKMLALQRVNFASYNAPCQIGVSCTQCMCLLSKAMRSVGQPMKQGLLCAHRALHVCQHPQAHLLPMCLHAAPPSRTPKTLAFAA